MSSRIMLIWRIEVIDYSLDIVAIWMKDVDCLEAGIKVSLFLNIIHAYYQGIASEEATCDILFDNVV